jgi:hypothetical protein
MPLDSYSLCPGGVDKKVKFCCPDLAQELQKLQRMIEGNQRTAARDLLDKLTAKHPGRPCLTTYKLAVLDESQNQAELNDLVNRFVEEHPENPIALARASELTAAEHGIEAGVAQLQNALERVGQRMPYQVYDALRAMAVAALVAGRPLCAIAHLYYQCAIDPQDEEPRHLLAHIQASPSLPLLFKDPERFVPSADAAPCAAEFKKALENAIAARWGIAARQFQAIAARHPDVPAVWHNLAILKSWLADNAGAVEALRRLAALKIPDADAVEAEALAQLLDARDGQLVDVVSIEYAVNDVDRLGELLASSDHMAALAVDQQHRKSDDQPPPRWAFVLLDRPLPQTGVDIDLDSVPRALASISVFGKQTDRPARLELVTFRTEELGAAQQLLASVAGPSLGSPGPETIEERVSALKHLLTPNLRPPNDTPAGRLQALRREFQQASIFQRWPRLPLAVLDGKSPREAQNDPRYQLKLRAAVLLLELAVESETADFDFNQLRESLALPPAEPIDPAQVEFKSLPLVRYTRLQLDKLPDEYLASVYDRAVSMHMRRVARRAAQLIISRDDMDRLVEFDDVYRTLIDTAASTDEALRCVDQARDWAVKNRHSSAIWDLEELSLRIRRAEGAEVVRLINHIQREHINEPRVGESLAALLYDAGIIGRDGLLNLNRPAAKDDALVPAAETAPESGAIWTPESETAGQQKSKLWIPGMD